jgi:hypothetical protein
VVLTRSCTAVPAVVLIAGIGAETLILRHPDKFTLAASWDFPADMDAYDEYGANSSDSYGTDASFQANYRLTPAFLAAHAAPFQANNRIWIGGYQVFQQGRGRLPRAADGTGHPAHN